MGKLSDFPRVGKFYFTRRGRFKVLAVKGKKITIQWQDNMEQVVVESSDLKKRLIDEKYAGEPDRYRQASDSDPRFMGKVEGEDDTEDEE